MDLARSIFLNLSPIDHRYSISEAALFEKLSACLSEQAAVLSCAKAEIALVKAHLFVRGALDKKTEAELDGIAQKIEPDAVYAEEKKTRHSIRALVNVLKALVPQEIAPLVHLGATSADILDSALAFRVRECMRSVVLPVLRDLELALCDLAEREAETPQAGRTHGQHAVPITFGFAIAEYVSRLGKSVLQIERLSRSLKGKMSGPVGAYNALCMIVEDPEELERLYLSFLGVEPSEHSTQIVEPEPLLRLLLECNVAFGIIANLADDLRNLQRSEIGEVFEEFSPLQVGSSAMPQKRNPWNSEHVKSLWKAFAPRAITFFMDQISEHQRDLTNSASSRFAADYIAGFALAAERMRSVVSSLRADREKMAANLELAGGKVRGGILAEPAYILLAQSGVSDAHEVIRKITLEAERSGESFYAALKKEEAVFLRISGQLAAAGIPDSTAFFSCPAMYRGLASSKAKRLAAKYSRLMEELSL